jgi:hypothetical protein
MKEKLSVQLQRYQDNILRELSAGDYQRVIQEVIGLGQLGDASGGFEPTDFTLDLYWHFRDRQDSPEQSEAFESLARAFSRLLDSTPSHGPVFQRLEVISRDV